ncbi:MAG: SDR family NAD(P)-dependent oxidoreductase, partial [Candidatus Rokuibacteriota bacterium]
MDLGIQGKAAIVTGGSRGIGRETARVLLEAGARVAICARSREALEQAHDELQTKAESEVLAVVADMAVEADVERLVGEATARWGGVDILVNNAGTMYSGRFEALTDAGLRTQLDTKVFGFMRAIRLVAPGMRARCWGRIVNVIGGAGKEPDPYMLGSGITNSALLNLTKALSTELGPDNVLVNAVCPGWV